MLIEIFTDTIFDETICDPSRGIESKKVPKTIISEKGDLKLRDMYLAARDTYGCLREYLACNLYQFLINLIFIV